MIFGLAILATAILLSAVAAYYSVAGLTAIFSAATIPVIIMGGSLELGKIVATVWLHNNWRRAPFLFKAYLVPAVAFLMLLTSMGIFGYLSKAHSDQSLVSGDSIAKVAIYDEKIKISKENIDANRRALKQMDEAVDQVMGRSTDEKGADKAVAIRRGQQKERSRLLTEIEAEQKRITQLNEERAPLAAEFRKVESEVGPIKYIAALVYGENPDANVLERAVRLVIIMIVLVFDPLALTLILAANKQFEWALHGRGGWVHDDDVVAVAQSTQKEKDSTDEEVVPVSQDPHPVGWMFDKFPYLRDGAGMFFKDLKPMPSTPPVPEVDTHVYDDERLVTPHDKQILAMGVDVVDRPGDYVTPPDEETDAEKEAKRAWKAEHPGETVKEQRYLHETGAIERLPWDDYLNLRADTDGSVSSIGRLRGFGIKFPDDPAKGDSFIRVDQMPSALYKYNGLKWIEVDKGLSDQYAYDTAYIDHLIDKLTTGEYDPELLNDAEREQVAQRLQTHTKGT